MARMPEIQSALAIGGVLVNETLDIIQQPVTINVTQDVEYVKHEAKVVSLLDCLTEDTSAGVDIRRNMQDVDVLPMKDVKADTLHGDVQHIIKHNMPDDIEKYVHWIGRTDQSVFKGLATFNKAPEQSVMLDLKYLLIEARQKEPPFLSELFFESEQYADLSNRYNYYGGVGY